MNKIETIFLNVAAIFKEKQPEQSTQNTTSTQWRSPYWDDSYLAPYNPDNLVGKKGITVYDDMLNDDQVKACLEVKKRLILSKGFDIVCDSRDAKDEEIRAYVAYIVGAGFQGLFTACLDEMLSAIQYGFSITEKVYNRIEDGKYSGMIGLAALKTRAPHTFEFPQDDYGQIKIVQNQTNGQVEIPKNKVLHYVYRKKFDNPYGQSDLRAAYRAWFFKELAIRSWGIFNDRHGVPLMIGKYESVADQPALQKALKNIQTKTVMTIPQGTDVTALDIGNKGEALIEAIRNADIMIARSLLIPELIGFTDHRTGSQALGREQMNLFFVSAIESVQTELEELLNEDLIKELVVMNFGKRETYPRIEFKPISDDDKNVLIENLVKLIEKGAIKPDVKDEEYLRKQLGLPEMSEQKKDSIQTQTDQIVPRETMTKFIEKIEKRKKTKYEQKIDFVEISTDLDELEKETAYKMSLVMLDIRNRLINHIRKNNIIDDKAYKEIEEIKINPMYLNELQSIWQTQMRKAFKTAEKTAKQELRSLATFAAEAIPLTPLISKDALKYLEDQAVRIKNITNDEVLKGVKNIMYSGIENGMTTDEIVYKMEEFFSNYDATQKIARKTKTEIKIDTVPIEQIPNRLETIVRTNIAKAYNSGRLASYSDPNLQGFVEAVQYSAILDDRTTDYCTKMDGLILDQKNPAHIRLMPPAHFNCRSTIIPITADEKFEYSTDEELAAAGKPAEGFGG